MLVSSRPPLLLVCRRGARGPLTEAISAEPPDARRALMPRLRAGDGLLKEGGCGSMRALEGPEGVKPPGSWLDERTALNTLGSGPGFDRMKGPGDGPCSGGCGDEPLEDTLADPVPPEDVRVNGLGKGDDR